MAVTSQILKKGDKWHGIVELTGMILNGIVKSCESEFLNMNLHN